MKKLLVILASAIVAVGCLGGSEKTDRTFTTNSTVSAYFKFIRVKEGKIPPHTVMVADLRYEELVVMLSLVGENVGSVYDLINDPNGDKAIAYKDVQEKFGDYNPNPTTFRFYRGKKGSGEWMYESGECVYYAFSEQVTSISITSSIEWTEEYPAGKELAPLFIAEFSSLGNFVRNGFTGSPITSYRRIVSELTADDMALLMESDWNIYGGTDLTLYTTTIPENIYDHILTITLTLDNGEKVIYKDKLANILLW
jgi:hypothetical protein